MCTHSLSHAYNSTVLTLPSGFSATHSPSSSSHPLALSGLDLALPFNPSMEHIQPTPRLVTQLAQASNQWGLMSALVSSEYDVMAVKSCTNFAEQPTS
jgi:hypothetical protein